jgi:hypothetical protein
MPCYEAFKTGMIMHEAISPSALEAYSRIISRYAARYGVACWGLIYQADTRFRRELILRMKRTVEVDYNAAIAAGKHHQYDPDLPWEYCLRFADREHSFWKLQLEDPCVYINTGAEKAINLVDGDAPIVRRTDQLITANESTGHANKAASSAAPSQRSEGAASPAKRARLAKTHNVGRDG